ncbi:alpha/beta fold hydrolase [Streptomyces chartreusis]|uniref:Alpha/beta hydrolase n=1 Tax=Streptomyces chartreusis TaxID=1969 RepID=A0A7H8T1I4_STRCX|nr:alpha/beta hydrolase [Streptomyces chartreusis]QKZ17291.1 alpha/beta hydrolase [Streptomyces chartreusis]
MTNIVLVHGLWADGSCWSETITELQALGHEPVAAQLSLESMEQDVAAVRRMLSTVEGPVLLVGWSYGGAVITNAAQGQEKVQALSYIAAFMPDEGESVSDIVRRRVGSVLPETLRVTEDGHSYIDRLVYGTAIAADAPAERTALASAVQKFARLGIDGSPSAAPAWRGLPSHYLVASEDRVLPAETQRELAARAGAEATEWATGHGPMFGRPKELATYLDGIAKGL